MSKIGIGIVALAASFGCSSSSGDGGSGGSAGGGAGGTGGTGGGSGQCPNVAGTWTISTHCDSSQVGSQVILTQNGCTVTDDEGTQIPVGSDGSFVYNGSLPDGTTITCSGTATESTITETCSVGGQQCDLTLTK
jgi:hypothetical protein